MITRQLKDKRIFNETFGSGPCTDLNACVGENGSQDLSIYGEGYLEAARQLLEPIVAARSLSNVDTLVFPISFCIRHGLELHLKQAIIALPQIRPTINVDRDKLTNTHEIRLLWNELSEKANLVDRRYAALLVQLEEHVSDYAEIDPNGQTFRYPKNKDSKKHLIRTPLINLERLLARLNQLGPLLNALERLTDNLVDEYGCGTYTKRLSREDIRMIAKQMPHWRDRHLPVFTETRKKLQEQLGIGGRAFNEALEIIKHHPEFSYELGILSPLRFLRTQDLALFMRCVEELETSRCGGPLSGTNFKKVIQRIRHAADLTQKCVDRLSTEARASIVSLYYLGREARYGELFKNYLEHELECVSNEDPLEYLSHVLTKNNARRCIERGLELTGQYHLLVNMDLMR